MTPAEFKPLLTALVLPPAGPLLLALAGLWLARHARRAGGLVVLLALAGLWLLSSHAVSLRLAHGLLPLPAPVDAALLARQRTQAVVVLGGGVLPEAPEFGRPQPSASTLERLRYGVHLARASRLPLAFAGGVGWAGRSTVSEGQVAAQVAREDFGLPLRWVDDRSRDTGENARLLGALLQAEGVRRIALVSDAWHLPRATLEFQRAGFEVLPAPTGLPFARERDLLEWWPSAHGLMASRQVLREWLALRVAALSSP